MNITLNTKEFNEAIILYLDSLGFSVDKFDINTRIVAGRSGNETRAEITLEPKEILSIQVEEDIQQNNLYLVRPSEPVKDNISSSGSDKEDKPPFETDKQTIGDIFNKGDK